MGIKGKSRSTKPCPGKTIGLSANKAENGFENAEVENALDEVYELPEEASV